MICENWDPFKKNEREALIKKMVLKPLGDEIRPVSCRFYGTESPCQRVCSPETVSYTHLTLPTTVSV